MKKEYEKAVKSYINYFCLKHELEFEFWVGDEVGRICCMGDYYFDFDNIRYDIDNDIERDFIFQWYDYALEHYHEKTGMPDLNYKNFCKSNLVKL